MSDSKKEALLKDLSFVLSTWKRHYPHKLPPMRILQIFENFQQIKEMIQKSGCRHIEQVYKKIGQDGLPVACNEQGNAGIYCKDCGIKLKEVI